MKSVTLVNPPQLNSLDDRLDPPLGLMYIAAVLEENKVRVNICDLAGRKEEDWLDLIPESDVYGMTVFSSSLNTARRIARVIKNRNKESVIVFGGPHPTSLPEETLKYPEVDYVIKGEGEYAFTDLVKDKKTSIKNGGIIQARSILNIDDLPLPARHLVDMQSYTREVEGKRTTSLITARGCPNNCNFCFKDVHGRTVRFRSTKKIIEEITGIQKKYDINSFIFYDDIFTLKRKRLSELCSKFEKMGITFRCNGHVGINTYEDYEMLSRAGCQEIAFGIESGSQKMLDNMNKRTTVKQNIDAITEAKRAGIMTKAYLISGFPGETKETIEETKRFMDRSDPDKFTVFQFAPFPGCDVYKNPDNYGVTSMNEDWDQFFNIAGNYEGGAAFETKGLSYKKAKALHDDLVAYLMKKGQKGELQPYMKKLNLEDTKFNNKNSIVQNNNYIYKKWEEEKDSIYTKVYFAASLVLTILASFFTKYVGWLSILILADILGILLIISAHAGIKRQNSKFYHDKINNEKLQETKE